MKTVLALDQGTTGSTALVIGADGRVLGRGYSEFTQHFPQPGWVEHDAEEIWQVTLKAARKAIKQAGHRPDAVGITNQRETIVAWDRASGRPLHRAIVWQDRRTADRCRALSDRLGLAFMAARTGLVWDPYFSGTKIEWLLDNVAGLRTKAEAGEAVFGTIDSWLVFRLTSGRSFVTDHTNASRTMLYNIRTHDWDDEMLRTFNVPRTSLPAIKRSSEIVGRTDASLLGSEIPVAGIAGDQQAALFGQACWAPGEAKCTYGTGAFLLLNLGEHPGDPSSRAGMLTTVACGSRGEPVYALEGSVFIAGAAVQWLRDGLKIVKQAAETEALARSVPDTGGVYLVPAFVGLGAPYWEAAARGTIVGLTRGTTRAHLVRAALESMAFSVRDVVDAMSKVSGVTLSELKTDGGAAANNWLMQTQADVLGVTVARPDMVETTALGAAGLAGLATGVWKTPEEFAGNRKYDRFAPATNADAGYREWQRAVNTALHWARHP